MAVKVFVRVEYTPSEETIPNPEARHNKTEHIVETVHTFPLLDETNIPYIQKTVTNTLITVLKSI